MGEFSLNHTALELLSIDEDIRFRFKNHNTKISDFEMFDFGQTWGSTALGFGGIGGNKITHARTYVFVPLYCDENCFVYFAGKFAYSVPYCQELSDDIGNCNMAAKNEIGRYLR